MPRGGKRAGAGRRPSGQVSVARAARDALTTDSQARADRLVQIAESFQKLLGAGGSALVTPAGESGLGPVRTTDAFVNYANNLGIDADNILTSSSSSFAPLTRVRTVLEWMYRGQFICRNAIDVPADDMTRQGARITGELEPDDISLIEAAVTNMAVWSRLADVVRWARLYGGALGWLLIEGQDPKSPFRIETVGKNQFKGILVLDRWMVEPSLEDLVTDISSTDLGMPKFYRVTEAAPALPKTTIHHSRVIRLQGHPLPYWQRLTENLWGESIFETIQDRITAFDLATTGAAQLVNKAYIRTYKIKGFREVLSTGGDALAGLTQFVDMMRRYQGIEGVTLLDGEDEFEGHQHGAFGGLAEIIEVFATQVSGATGIPKSKLFGTGAHGGLNSGDSDPDTRNYYDKLRSGQIADLKVPVTVVYRCIAQSLGIKLPKDFGVEFNPLWQMTDGEKADIAQKTTEPVLAAEAAGLISPQVALKELKQQSVVTGVFSNITDDDIMKAEDEPVPPAEDAMVAAGAEGGESEGKPAPGKTAKPAPGKKPAEKLPESKNQKSKKTKDGAPGPVDLNMLGFGIRLEQLKGELRTSRDPSNWWVVRMPAHYGYLVGTGSAEGPDEGLDCFVGPNTQSESIFLVDQRRLGPVEASGASAATEAAFDEHKMLFGWDDQAAALDAYARSYSDGRGLERVMNITPCTAGELQQWLATGDVTKPYRPFGPETV